MAFAVSADAYDRFMGRYSTLLSPLFADFAGIGGGMRVVDVGCGPGILTAELVARTGTERVTAIDPSPPFVEAMHERFPAVDARGGAAEQLPYPDDGFDAALAQLVVHFMSDPVGGIAEMGRVTRPGGTVAACTWDLQGERSPIAPLWQAVRSIDPGAESEERRPGGSRESLDQLFRQAGLGDVVTSEIEVVAHHTSFEEWWEPFALGVGPAGAYVARQDSDRRAAIREACRELLPAGPHDISWYVWASRGTAA